MVLGDAGRGGPAPTLGPRSGVGGRSAVCVASRRRFAGGTSGAVDVLEGEVLEVVLPLQQMDVFALPSNISKCALKY